jgi:hypothetical protein
MAAPARGGAYEEGVAVLIVDRRTERKRPGDLGTRRLGEWTTRTTGTTGITGMTRTTWTKNSGFSCRAASYL